MGLFSFIKSAGDKLFGKENAEEKAQKVEQHLKNYGFKGLDVKVDDETVIVSGEVDTLQTKNRVLVAAGNIEGVSNVEDKMTVKEKEPANVEVEKMFYEVKKGDSLSKISKEVYGDAMKYNVIFEANKPMLKDPNLIYPGQKLVIPEL
ncbi:LysM domain-containing protein [Balneicella halophila]|uniref:Potassium binding protein Kbp n=1 Tax=Balneicella halophila TaxID=1537566 RepID=A0A7L4UP68_BALHA|nr:peptidoglycan-binding protein LysM [Balneicella halophila]PVX50824.1 LysM domain-containing protein [Balneicella halophila]